MKLQIVDENDKVVFDEDLPDDNQIDGRDLIKKSKLKQVNLKQCDKCTGWYTKGNIHGGICSVCRKRARNIVNNAQKGKYIVFHGFKSPLPSYRVSFVRKQNNGVIGLIDGGFESKQRQKVRLESDNGDVIVHFPTGAGWVEVGRTHAASVSVLSPSEWKEWSINFKDTTGENEDDRDRLLDEIEQVTQEFDRAWTKRALWQNYKRKFGVTPEYLDQNGDYNERGERELFFKAYDRDRLDRPAGEEPDIIAVETSQDFWYHIPFEEANQTEVLNWLQHRCISLNQDEGKIKHDLGENWLDSKFGSTVQSVSFGQLKREEFSHLI